MLYNVLSKYVEKGDNMQPNLWLVIPCYNEEKMLEISPKVISEKMQKLIDNKVISPQSQVLFIDDGSKDKTWQKIKNCKEKDSLFRGIKLAHNAGHQNALMAGMMYSMDKCDCIVSMDADLQDDINAIDEMVEKYNDGCEIVYGVRSSRKKDTVFKRNTAQLFYKFMGQMGVEVVYDHADYRLVSNVVLHALEKYKETSLFLRGIIPSLGFKTDKVFYERKERVAGESKYPLRKMLSFAFDGITSFTVKPLHMIFILGFLFSILSICGLLYSLISFFCGKTVEGWTTTVCSIWFIGGVNMLCFGIIGEYIGKIYFEVKRRPRYIIEETTNNDEGEKK